MIKTQIDEKLTEYLLDQIAEHGVSDGETFWFCTSYILSINKNLNDKKITVDNILELNNDLNMITFNYVNFSWEIEQVEEAESEYQITVNLKLYPKTDWKNKNLIWFKPKKENKNHV